MYRIEHGYSVERNDQLRILRDWWMDHSRHQHMIPRVLDDLMDEGTHHLPFVLIPSGVSPKQGVDGIDKNAVVISHQNAPALEPGKAFTVGMVPGLTTVRDSFDWYNAGIGVVSDTTECKTCVGEYSQPMYCRFSRVRLAGRLVYPVEFPAQVHAHMVYDGGSNYVSWLQAERDGVPPCGKMIRRLAVLRPSLAYLTDHAIDCEVYNAFVVREVGLRIRSEPAIDCKGMPTFVTREFVEVSGSYKSRTVMDIRNPIGHPGEYFTVKLPF